MQVLEQDCQNFHYEIPEVQNLIPGQSGLCSNKVTVTLQILDFSILCLVLCKKSSNRV